MINEREKLIAYIESVGPVKECINVIHGLTTYDDIEDIFDGENLREKSKRLYQAIMATAGFYEETNEIHMSPSIAAALILVGANIVMPYDQKDLPKNCVAFFSWEGEKDIAIIEDPDACSIKFFK